MSRVLLLLVLIGLMVWAPISVFAAVKAFPGAEGFGSETVGGRGGRIIEIVNLNPSGAGSLRACIEASGPRICIFRTGGTITLAGAINIKNPYITIAGQTAPGDGILLKGGEIDVKTHDVIIRGLRIRVGDDPVGVEPLNRDAMNVGSNSSEVYNVIFDHNSLSWAIDENFSTWYAGTHDITFQWNIISESLTCSIHPEGCHGKAFLLGDHSKRISVHHNVFAHNNDRNPEIKGDTTAEIINNIIYDWGTRSLIPTTLIGDWEGSGANFANIIGNYYIKGPSSSERKGIGFTSRIWPESKIYVKGNIGPGRPNDTGNDWTIVEGPTQYQSLTPATPLSDVTIDPVTTIYEKVLQSVGATSPKRDHVDERVILSVKNRSGKLINSQSEVDGWPLLDSGTAPTDSDHDGMPDSWEVAHGLDPQVNDSAGDTDNNGYTNVEEYINSFFQSSVLSPTPNNTLTVSLTQSPSQCSDKNRGDADCNSVIELTDFEIWRKEYFAQCTEITLDTCGLDDDHMGTAMDADFNNLPEVVYNNVKGIALPDFEVWRKGYFPV